MKRALAVVLLLTACKADSPATKHGNAGTPGTAGGSDTGAPTAAGALEGDAGSAALDAIPDLDPPDYGADPNVEAWSTVKVSTARVVLVVEPDATVGEVNTVLEAIDAHILGGASAGGLLVVGVAPGTATEARDIAEGADGIAGVMVDHTVEVDRLGTAHSSGDPTSSRSSCASDLESWRWDDGSTTTHVAEGAWDTPAWRGANWGLKFARVPLAWNLRDHLVRVGQPAPMGFVDSGFWEHPDLPGLDVRDLDGIDHALGVVSTAAATFNDGSGIEGVFPRGSDLSNPLHGAWFNEEGVADHWVSRMVLQAARVLQEGAKVVNLSLGISNAYQADVVSDELRAGLHALIEEQAALWSGMVDVRGHLGVGEFLVTCSAGNAGLYDEVAQWNSGCGYLSVAGHSRFLTVEALAHPGNVHGAFSNTGGTLSAPGTCVGMASSPLHGPGWKVENGTSFAAPFVAGAIAMLWSAAPDADHTLIRQALFDGAHPPVSGIAPRVDVFGAMLALDALRSNETIATELADLDDGSIDGNLRRVPEGSELDADDYPASGRRGDGCVDLKDLRALRDAIIDTRDPGTDTLDGRSDHPNRDLNADGVHLPYGSESYPEDADAERVWSRFDLNGDLAVDERDIDTMAEVWGATDPDRCPDADTGGIAREDLHQWLHSVDYWVRIDPGETPVVMAEGAPAQRVVEDDLDGGWLYTTGRLDCADRQEVKVCTRTEGTDMLETACETQTLQPGQDPPFSDLAPIELASGMLFLQQRHGYGEDPAKVWTSLGGGTTTDFDLEGGEQLRFSSGFSFHVAPDGDEMVFGGCDGEDLDRADASACLRFMELTTGTTHTGMPDASLRDWRVQEWADDGRVVMQAYDSASDPRFYVVDDADWDFTDAQIVPDMWTSNVPRLLDRGRVVVGGGQDGDRDSNGIHVTTTYSVLSYDAEAEAPICLPYADDHLTDVFRAVVPNGNVVSADGRVLTYPFGTTTPGTSVMSSDGSVALELDSMVAEYGAWSPDGRMVAFSAWEQGTVVAMLGGGDTWSDPAELELETLPVMAGNLVWSPDGSALMIVDDAHLIWGEADVWVFTPATGELAVLENQHEVASGLPAWSPDSSEIATSSWFTDTLVCDGDTYDFNHLDIVVQDLVGGTPDRVTETWVEGSPSATACGPYVPTTEWGVRWQ